MNKDELKKLHDLGFALHWVQPRAKMPVESAWSTGPRKDFVSLARLYHKGYNVGVRLGEPSVVGGLYLAALDCDMKSKDPKHLDEMNMKLAAIFPNYGSSAFCISGRGNGSKHVYVLTSKPVSPQRLAQSSEKVLVSMPSITTFSKFEKETMKPEDMKNGFHLRAAWEISLMGTGNQIVLPPSIHPDSGKPYKWGVAPVDVSSFGHFEIDQSKSTKNEGEKINDFKATVVDLLFSHVPDSVQAQIVDGDGVEDRSAALLGVSCAMLRAGFTDNEVLSVLTEPSYFLGQVGYEHTQSKKRSVAAEWVRKYTLEKAKRETLAVYDFENEVIETPTVMLDDKAAIEQAKEICPKEKDFRRLIERGGQYGDGAPKNTLKNVVLILQGVAGKDVFKRDEFANSEVYGKDAPWGGRTGDEIKDIDTVRVKAWLADNFGFEPSDDRINQAMAKISDTNRFHPVREYLDTLEWDGKSRIDTWIKRYLGGTAPEPYLSAVSRKTLVAMIKRIYEPGCKFDHVLILEGNQGAGKSTALRNLCGDEWFTDAHINVQDKDAVMTMRSKWVIELGELSGMRSADVELLKEFVSRQTDRIRVPYGKRTEDFPRQCIFIGTTNKDEYLKDTTGNRRYWPVDLRKGRINFKAIKRDRDQLLAEAKFCYEELAEPIYLEDPEMNEGAIREQEARSVSDVWSEKLEAFFQKVPEKKEGEHGKNWDRFLLKELFEDFGPLAGVRDGRGEQLRASDALRKLGFQKRNARDEQGHVRKYWVGKDN